VDRDEPDNRPLIAVVGPCASGKTLLVQALKERGYNAREVLQEHSYVPAMWQRITQPDILIYLDISEETARQRRPTSAPRGWWRTLEQRLSHAKKHADLYLRADQAAPHEVLEEVLAFLHSFSF
jgi:deoxyadenosine/deoxycytidine kinase